MRRSATTASLQKHRECQNHHYHHNFHYSVEGYENPKESLAHWQSLRKEIVPDSALERRDVVLREGGASREHSRGSSAKGPRREGRRNGDTYDHLANEMRMNDSQRPRTSFSGVIGFGGENRVPSRKEFERQLWEASSSPRSKFRAQQAARSSMSADSGRQPYKWDETHPPNPSIALKLLNQEYSQRNRASTKNRYHHDDYTPEDADAQTSFPKGSAYLHKGVGDADAKFARNNREQKKRILLQHEKRIQNIVDERQKFQDLVESEKVRRKKVAEDKWHQNVNFLAPKYSVSSSSSRKKSFTGGIKEISSPGGWRYY